MPQFIATFVRTFPYGTLRWNGWPTLKDSQQQEGAWMKYQHAVWIHDNDYDPIDLFSEIDEALDQRGLRN